MINIKKDKDLLKLIFISTFIIGFFAHGYFFVNHALSHDNLWAFDAHREVAMKLENGRFAQILNFMFRGYYAVPWLVGILSLIYIAISIYLVVKLFNIKSKVLIICIPMVLVVNTVVTTNIATFYHEIDAYMLAFLLAVLGVYVMQKHKFGFLLSIVLFILSMGLYQAYVQVAIACSVILCILETLDNIEIKTIIMNGIKRVLTLIASFFSYNFTYNFVLSYSGYDSASRMNKLGGLSNYVSSNIFDDVYQGIMEMYNFFLNPVSHELFAENIIKYANILFFILAASCLIWLVVKNKLNWLSICMLVVLVVAFMFGSNVMRHMSIESGGYRYYWLLKFSNIFAYILGFIVIERSLNYKVKFKLKEFNLNFVKIVVIVLVTNITMQNIVYSNQVYYKKVLNYDSVLETMSRIVDDLEDLEGYKIGETEVLFTHAMLNSSLYSSRNMMPYLANNWYLVNGVISFGISYVEYFQNVLMYPMQLHELTTSGSIQERIEAYPELIDMPTYPNKGSIQMVDGVVLVKISQTGFETYNSFEIGYEVDSNIINFELLYPSTHSNNQYNIAWYIFKDDERVDVVWYEYDNYLTVDTSQYGEGNYYVQAYIKNSEGNTVTSAMYSDNVIIQGSD
ncbi:MAG: glucosyltransferase domain-containing protein [Clostridia bacterium]